MKAILRVFCVGLCATSLSLSHAAGVIEEVVVTAQKRSESVQDVPIAIQALSADRIAERNIDSAVDILDMFANINANAANEVNTGFTIRGVGTNNFHPNRPRAVGVYQDEVSRGTPYSGILGVYDMERIEVLRGPQNTLFGRNTTGGAINYITAKPTIGEQGWDGYLTGNLGDHSLRHFQGALGFSAGESFGIRLSGESNQRDGLFTNRAPGREGEELDERDRQSFRLQGLWAPNDRFEALFNYHVAESDGSNIGNKAVGQRDINDPSQPCTAIPSGVSAYQRVSPCGTSFGFNPSTNDWHTVYNVSSAIQDVELDGGFAKLAWAGDSITVTSITAIESLEVVQADDNSGGDVLYFLPTQDAEFEQFSQELRIQGDHEGFRWIAGLYYFEEDMRLATIVRRDANGAVTPPPAPGAGQVAAYNFLDQTDEDLSLYAQVEYDLTPDTTLTVGVRYTENEKEGTSLFGVVHAPHLPWGPDQLLPQDQVYTQSFVENQIASGQIEAVPQFNVVCGPGGGIDCGKVKQDLDEVGYKLGIDHQLNESTLLYGSISRGFKAGGFDVRALAALNGDATRPVDPEILHAYEVGFKWDSEDARVRINGSVFFNLWEDHQVFALVDSIPALTNVAEAEIFGVELEALWAPTDQWLVSASVGTLDSEITDSGGLTGIDEGHVLRNNPELSSTLGITRYFTMSSGELSLSANLRYTDEMQDSLENRDGEDRLWRHDALTVIDLRAAYSFGGDDQYLIAVWGENITSEEWCNDIGFNDPPSSTAVDALNTVGNCSPNDGDAQWGVTGTIRF